MAKNRQIPRLDDLSFEALLRYRMEITPNSEEEYGVLIRYKLKKEISIFLQAIADGNQDTVEELLNDNPQLVEVAFGTVSTLSLDTIENVTPIQLAYILEDEKITKALLEAVDKLGNPITKEKVKQQLAIKIAEVEEQELQFKKFDFSDLITSITHDQNLKDTGKASTETEKAFAAFKEYFKPKVVTKGRPFNMQDLQEAYEVYDKHWGYSGYAPWDLKQQVWFLHNVILFLLGRVAASYAQVFSNGLSNPFKRSFNLANYIDNGEPDYYLACHSPSLERSFIVDIYYGARWLAVSIWVRESSLSQAVHLNDFVTQKQQEWKNLISSLSKERQEQVTLGAKK